MAIEQLTTNDVNAGKMTQERAKTITTSVKLMVMGAIVKNSSYDINVHIDNAAQTAGLSAPEHRDAIEVKKEGTNIVFDMLLFEADSTKGGDDEIHVQYASALQKLEDCSVETRDEAQAVLIEIISQSIQQLTLPEAKKTDIKNMLQNQGVTKLGQILGTDLPQLTSN